MSSDPYHSLKCGVASFFANYVVGFFHPLELIKTRFQSTCLPIKAMMANSMKILFPNMMESSRHSRISIAVRESEGCIRDCILIYLAKP